MSGWGNDPVPAVAWGGAEGFGDKAYQAADTGGTWGTTQEIVGGATEPAYYDAQENSDFAAESFGANTDSAPNGQATFVPKPAPKFGFDFKTFGVTIPEADSETAWKQMLKVAREPNCEIAVFKEWFVAYCKAITDEGGHPKIEEIAKAMMDEELPVWLIAIARPLPPMFCIVNMKGDFEGLTYALTIQRGPDAPNEKLKTHWPESQEQNLERLALSGFTVASDVAVCRSCGAAGHMLRDCPNRGEKLDFTPKCVNCEEEGHFTRHCTKERSEPGKKKMTCRHCDQEGHVARDCPDKVDEPITCRKCNEEGHMSRECPNGGSGGGACRKCGEEGHFARECLNSESMPSGCRNCGEEGHMSRECPQPKDMSKMQCRNCDEFGHASRECPKPRDYSRVTCRNCNQKGHTAVRCKEPPQSNGFNDGSSFSGFSGAGGDMGGAIVDTVETSYDFSAANGGTVTEANDNNWSHGEANIESNW